MALTRTIHKRDGTHILGDEWGRASGTRMPGRTVSGMWRCVAHGGSTYGYHVEAMPGGGWGTRLVVVTDLDTGKMRRHRFKGGAVREEEILGRLER